MKITVNGRTINSSGGITIINGRVIGADYFKETQKVDEIKHVELKKIKGIRIEADLANVTITTSNRTDIEVHYYGEVCTDGKIEFNVTTSGNEIEILAKINANIFNGNLKLDVIVPQRIFNLISVECKNGNAKIFKNVKAQKININSQNGNIKSEASFKELMAKSMNGNIDIFIMAESNIKISASSMNGNVNLVLQSIRFFNVSTSSMNGSVINRYNPTGKYEAIGNISSMNGSVKVQ